MLLYVIALLPILVYVLVVKAMDGFSLASWKRLFPSFVWGMSCCGTLFFVAKATGYENPVLSTFLEEFLKCIPLVWAICRKRVAFLAEALIYGTAIGAGFAFLENIVYMTLLPGFSLGDAPQIPAGGLF
ncbi:MAG: PrsW family glutamic-type intramembrane protease [Bacteroidales bacterium]|nr:PrsW family glutamic-type intramembrane protease [Bacteroidales bacterium]